jgi:hypothetical protein
MSGGISNLPAAIPINATNALPLFSDENLFGNLSATMATQFAPSAAITPAALPFDPNFGGSLSQEESQFDNSLASTTTVPVQISVPSTTTAATGTASQPTSPPANTSGPSTTAAPTGAQLESILNGDATTVAQPGEQAPAGMTVAQIDKLDNGLLGNLGDQNLQGQGTIKQLLSQKVGGDITTNANAAWDALQDLEAVKNENNSDGSAMPSSVAHDGKIDGFTKSGEAPHGSQAGSLQDFLLHNRSPTEGLESDPSPQCGANGTSASGLQTFDHEVDDAFKTLGNDIKNVFVGIGHGIEDFAKGIGNGVKDFFTGHIAQAAADVIGGVTGGVNDVVKPVTALVGDTLDDIPGVGHVLGNVVTGIGDTYSNYLTGVGNTAEDVAQGNWSKVGQDALGTLGAAAQLAPMFIPGAGEVAAGAEVAVDGAEAAADGAMQGAMQGVRQGVDTTNDINDAANYISGLVSPPNNNTNNS